METDSSVKTIWSDEAIIDLIRKVRNDLIKDFLDERYMKEYVALHFRIKEIPTLKVETLKTTLKQMLIAPVDTLYYKRLIDQIRETDTASLSEGNEALFYKEIEAILRNDIY